MTSKNLVIVESPAKAKTISKYLGNNFTVKSSIGHIRDLPKKGISIDIENGFEPTYEIPAAKKKVVNELKKDIKSNIEVWLATDEDREGEAIAWHLTQALKLDPSKTKRIVFHEITKSAIDKAVENPRTIDINLVDAQQARRILDRLVGYKLSPVLWKKLRPGLSAGRVQSVAVRLIVEREREIKDFEAESKFKVSGEFISKSDIGLPAELKTRFSDEDATAKFLKDCIGSNFTVAAVDKKPGKRNPGAPFTTSSLQQEASRKLGYSVRQTMTLAQKLYENGHITYMRTDSTTLSAQALKSIENYIKNKHGNEYHKFRQFKTKSSGAQEAHEAIRPTNVNAQSAGTDDGQKKLYDLIWRRAVASQMAPAEIDRTEIVIDIDNRDEQFLSKGEVLKFDGFYKVYGGGKDDVILPDLKPGETLDAVAINALETFSKPPARFSEASLVRKLEELGIGRPSTYAPTISTIQDRGYIEKKDIEGREIEVIELKLKGSDTSRNKLSVTTGADRNKLLPTPIAGITTDFLVKHFTEIVDYDFTATVEKDFDRVAQGDQKWQEMISTFYKEFVPLLTNSESISREEAINARQLGTDPKSGKTITARIGRYGPMLQRGDAKDEEKPDFAPLPVGTDMDNVTLKQALEMFKLPRKLGHTPEGMEVIADIGRFGPYVKVGSKFISIKGRDPFDVTLEEAIKLYEEKLDQDSKKNIKEFNSGLKVLDGPYGPYISDGKRNARIPKDKDPKKITEDEAKALLDAAPKRRGFRRGRAKKKS